MVAGYIFFPAPLQETAGIILSQRSQPFFSSDTKYTAPFSRFPISDNGTLYFTYGYAITQLTKPAFLLTGCSTSVQRIMGNGVIFS